LSTRVPAPDRHSPGMLNAATRTAPGGGTNFLIQRASLSPVSSMNICIQRGIARVRFAVFFAVCHRFTVVSYCIPGSPQGQSILIFIIKSRAPQRFSRLPAHVLSATPSFGLDHRAHKSFPPRTEWFAVLGRNQAYASPSINCRTIVRSHVRFALLLHGHSMTRHCDRGDRYSGSPSSPRAGVFPPLLITRLKHRTLHKATGPVWGGKVGGGWGGVGGGGGGGGVGVVGWGCGWGGVGGVGVGGGWGGGPPPPPPPPPTPHTPPPLPTPPPPTTPPPHPPPPTPPPPPPPPQAPHPPPPPTPPPPPPPPPPPRPRPPSPPPPPTQHPPPASPPLPPPHRTPPVRYSVSVPTRQRFLGFRSARKFGPRAGAPLERHPRLCAQPHDLFLLSLTELMKQPDTAAIAARPR